MSLRDVLLQIARTAAIVVVGAAALLMLLHVIAGFPNGHLLIVFVLAAPLAALLAWVAAEAMRSGELPHRLGVDYRDKAPVAFWTGVTLYAGGAAALAAMSLYALAQLLVGTGD